MQDAAETPKERDIRVDGGRTGAHPAPTREEFGNGWLLVASGSLAAIAAAALWCTPPLAPLRSVTSLLLRCLSLLLVTAVAGAAGLWGASLFSSGSSPRRRSFFVHALMGWIFLPCMALAYRAQLAWALPVTAAAAAVMAVSLGLLAPRREDVSSDPADGIDRAFRSFYGIQITGFRPGRALVIALCAQGTLILSVTEDTFAAGILLGIGTFLLLWYWSAEVGIATVARRRIAFARGTIASALILTLLVLLPWVVRHGGSIPLAPRRPLPAQAAERARVRPHFSSVILWPPPKRVTTLYFPAPSPLQPTADKMTRPLEIPFDGPYWYFEPPDEDPGPMAHIAHGLPTESAINMSSADGGPLRMQAVERLARPIALGCCGGLDVSVSNADAHEGPIHVGVLLTDNGSPDRASELLGFATLATSETAFFADRRAPVEDTAHFTIPPSRVLRRFDQITVIVIPSLDNSRGAKVAIRGFTLLPK